MQKLFALTSLFVATAALAGFTDNQQRGGFSDTAQPKIISVQAALKAADDTPVALRGKIIRQLDKDEFIFRDASGEIKIEVENEAWNGQNITPNDEITIQGKVDTNGLKASEIEVYKIQKH